MGHFLHVRPRISVMSAWSWVLFCPQFTVPNTMDTLYWCKIFKVPPLSRKHHMIGVSNLRVGQLCVTFRLQMWCSVLNARNSWLRGSTEAKKSHKTISYEKEENHNQIIIIIIIISNLSNDRSKTSSKTIPPHSAI